MNFMSEVTGPKHINHLGFSVKLVSTSKLFSQTLNHAKVRISMCYFFGRFWSGSTCFLVFAVCFTPLHCPVSQLLRCSFLFQVYRANHSAWFNQQKNTASICLANYLVKE